ncbi:hypothetical protein OAL09_05315 [Verrucomicrobia bacterium]|nr:hypothetical protein [Verrucomicrobiota bacterium]
MNDFECLYIDSQGNILHETKVIVQAVNDIEAARKFSDKFPSRQHPGIQVQALEGNKKKSSFENFSNFQPLFIKESDPIDAARNVYASVIDKTIKLDKSMWSVPPVNRKRSSAKTLIQIISVIIVFFALVIIEETYIGTFPLLSNQTKENNNPIKESVFLPNDTTDISDLGDNIGITPMNNSDELFAERKKGFLPNKTKPPVEMDSFSETEPPVEINSFAETEPSVEIYPFAKTEQSVEIDSFTEMEPPVEIDSFAEPEPPVEIDSFAEPEPPVAANNNYLDPIKTREQEYRKQKTERSDAKWQGYLSRNDEVKVKKPAQVMVISNHDYLLIGWFGDVNKKKKIIIYLDELPRLGRASYEWVGKMDRGNRSKSAADVTKIFLNEFKRKGRNFDPKTETFSGIWIGGGGFDFTQFTVGQEP